MNRPRETPYRDELLADGSVHRRYEDGREEWRRREGGTVVRWHDNRGAAGTDELLGGRIIKRWYADGTVAYGRDIGYGRTVWGQGETVMVNRTSFGGRVGVLLGGLGLATLAVTAAQFPPVSLSPEEEEELRQQAAAQNSSGGDAGGGGSYDDGSGGDSGAGDPGDSGDPGGSGGDSGDWDSGDDWNSDDGGWSDDDFG
ncbi:hypothetical protein ACFYYH_05310 [Streptomyces sp. NPDC002018]|uniref:hypothetical protein n=1 Tax=Streptomyces sp. NPDC002018 TaxID=3364629 RepID=UPI0036AA99E0